MKQNKCKFTSLHIYVYKLTWRRAFEQLEREMDVACGDSIRRMEDAGQLVVTDGEQRLCAYATYPLIE
jgi:hypothetical protein